MPVAAVIGAAAIGGVTSVISGNKAAGAAKDAADKSAEVQRYMFDQGQLGSSGIARSARISLPARKTSFNRLVEPGAVN